MILFKLDSERVMMQRAMISHAMDSSLPGVVQAKNGLWLIFTHADEDGYLVHMAPEQIEAAIANGALVICCFPGKVRKRYPGLKTAGSWDEPTNAMLPGDGNKYNKDTILVYPASHAKRVALDCRS